MPRSINILCYFSNTSVLCHLISVICVSLASCYLTPSTPIEIVPVSRLGNLFYLTTLPRKRPSHTTFLDPDTHWAIEGVHPKERVTPWMPLLPNRSSACASHASWRVLPRLFADSFSPLLRFVGDCVGLRTLSKCLPLGGWS